MDLPQTLRYSKDHEWLRIEDEEAVVGITAYAADELGDVVVRGAARDRSQAAEG